MEYEILNRSICEEMEGELDVAEGLDRDSKTNPGFGKLKYEEEFDSLKKHLKDLEDIILDMEDFCASRKNMFLPIRQGIKDAKITLSRVNWSAESMDSWHSAFVHHLGRTMGESRKKAKKEAGKKDVENKETQADLDGEAAFTIAKSKRPRASTVSPQEATSRPPAKRLKSRAEGVKPETETKKRKEEPQFKPPKRSRSRRALPDAVLIKTAEGCSYADMLRDLKQKVTPDELGVKVKGVRETRNGDVLIEIGATAEDRAKLTSAIKEAVGKQGDVRELVPLSEVEIEDIDSTIDAEGVNVALQEFFGEKMAGEVRVNLTKKPFRGRLKAYATMREDMAARLIRAGHVKIGWILCAVRTKKKAKRCYRCQGYGHLAANCDGPDRKACCWRCGSDKHRAAACTNTPQCFLCAAKEEKPRTDHLPGTAKCAAFKDATRQRRPRKAAR